MPPQDDVAFRSQQYAQQVSESIQPAQEGLNNAIRGFGQTAGQAFDRIQNKRESNFQMGMAQRKMAMEQQEKQLRDQIGASQLALDRIRREGAAEDLRFTKELHSVDMLAAQKETFVANKDAAVAMARLNQLKAEKAAEELGPDIPFDEDIDETIEAAASVGIHISLGKDGAQVTDRVLTETEKKAAGERLKEIRLGKTRMQGEYSLQRENARLQARLEELERKFEGQGKLQEDKQAAVATEGEKDRTSREGIAAKSQEGQTQRAQTKEEGVQGRADDRLGVAQKAQEMANLKTRFGMLSKRLNDPAAKVEMGRIEKRMKELQAGGAAGTMADKVRDALNAFRPRQQ